MNSIQEAKQELEAAIRYAENAIASAKQTIESIATSQEQTGTKSSDAYREAELEAELQRQKDISQGYYDSMMSFKDALDERREEKQPTMPVIPKAVAIAIFREGVQHGVEAACTELDEATFMRIEESEYVGDFHVTFERDIDLNDHIDTDWMRDKCGDYSEERVIDALGTLCADNEFECRIHGVDDNPTEK